MLEKAQEGIKKAIHHLEMEFAKLQLGRANPAMVEDIRVEQYGSLQPIKNCASISLLDNFTLTIQPWDKTLLHAIAKAISDEGLGLNPQGMWDSVLIKVPLMTEEKRRDATKIAKNMAEEAKVGVRNARGESLKDIQSAEKAKTISEDVLKSEEKELQKLVDDANKKIDELYKKKETDIMKI